LKGVQNLADLEESIVQLPIELIDIVLGFVNGCEGLIAEILQIAAELLDVGGGPVGFFRHGAESRDGNLNILTQLRIGNIFVRGFEHLGGVANRLINDVGRTFSKKFFSNCAKD